MNIEDILNISEEFDSKDKESIKKNGVVFTNKKICEHIILKLKPSINDKICEPSVGKGSFVFNLLEYFRTKYTINQMVDFVENRLFCYDIIGNFIEDFKNLLVEYFKILNYTKKLKLKNIKIQDFLLVNDNFNIIFGNPPFVRIQNLEGDYLEKLKIELDSVKLGNIDLYFAFLEKSLKLSNKVGFIIPNSFLKNKSGKFLKNLIKDRLEYLYDFKNEKVWKNISTYTCILICNKNKSENFEYSYINSNIKKIDKKNWCKTETENKLKKIIIYCNGGIATLSDDVFKFDNCDDNYCYKGNIKIEKSICKKAIKATTKDFYYFIYPYNSNNKILDETDIKNEYPLCYQYLLSRKSKLESRDKGKTTNYDSWYSYGRRQGLITSINSNYIKIILPITFLKSRGLHYFETEHDTLVISGISVILQKHDKEKFINLISSEEFYKYLEDNNKTLADNKKDNIWLTITTTSLRNY